MSHRTVAILGASENREKFGNKSVRAHLAEGFEVFPINPKATEVEGLKCYPSLKDLPVNSLDRISVYVPPKVGVQLLDEIAAANAKEVWFNPGSDSPDLIDRAREMGINVIQACSIVDVGHMPGEFTS